ncbi:MAG: alpha/beta hydrolase domain-containing protein [Deltaproteobacteria bacterium]|nr:alpha/beta hydrolase domain-containing protein [Deltaproteobacteria bacterium]
MSITLEIEERTPFAEGADFGSVGAYERIRGRARFAIDPRLPANRDIVDLTLASADDRGLVEYSTEFFLIKPADMGRGNGRLLYDVNNRGNKRALQFFNDAPPNNDPRTAEDAGHGFLMRRGYTVVWCGWQGDLLPGDGRLTMDLPVATGPDGPVTGPFRAEFIIEQPGVTTVSLGGHDYIRPCPAADLRTEGATLTRRRLDPDPREPVPAGDWQFATADAAGSVWPSATNCHLPEGFRPGWIHELIYTAKDPLVLGLGFAGVRDLVDFLRHADEDAAGQANPLRDGAQGVAQAYAWGRSQSGRFLRGFVYGGFNVSDGGRRIFDGIFSHVAGGGRLQLNYRFAQPDRYPRQHEDHLYPSEEFPFAYGRTEDPFTGREDAVLKRPETDPVVIHTQTATEYWQRRGSLVHTDTRGNDLPEHENIRVYLLSSLQHNDAAAALEGGVPRYPQNPLPANPVLRALLDALDEWVTDGVPPPESRVPTRSAGDLVTGAEFREGFPAVPRSACPEPHALYHLDRGAEFAHGVISREPPVEDKTREYPVRVPSVDADGNETAGIRVPEVAAPLATYLGWNLRKDSDVMAGIVGSALPFAVSERTRAEQGDPRPSVQSRYPSRNAYLDAVRAAAVALEEDRLLLAEDVDRCVAAAGKRWDARRGNGSGDA